MGQEQHGIESAVFEKIDHITFELWSLPHEGSPAQQAAHGIPTLEEAWTLMDQLGGDTMFQVRDSSGTQHHRLRSSGPAQQDFSANPGHPSYYKAGNAPPAPFMDTAIADFHLWEANVWKAARSCYGGLALMVGNFALGTVVGSVLGFGEAAIVCGFMAVAATIVYLIVPHLQGSANNELGK